MVESSPSRQRRPPCKTNKGMSDEAADAAALTYLLTYSHSIHIRGHFCRSFMTTVLFFFFFIFPHCHPSAIFYKAKNLEAKNQRF